MKKLHPDQPSLSRRKLLLLVIKLISLLILLLLESLLLLYVIRRLPQQVISIATPTPILIINLSSSSFRIVTDRPPIMQVHQSYIVSVSLVPKGQPFVSLLAIEKATPITEKAHSVGTPGATLKDAFSATYKPIATATLSPTDGPFEIKPVGPVEEPLSQPQVTWKWTVIPQEIGTNYLSIDIEGTWKSASGDDLGPYRLGENNFSIEVRSPPPTPVPAATPEPFVSVSPVRIDIGSIMSTILPYILGTGGAAGLLIVLFRKKIVRSQTSHPNQTNLSPKKKRVKRKP